MSRIVPAVLVAVLSLFALRDSAAQVVAKFDPGLAHTLAPWDGRITAADALAVMQAAALDKPKVAPEALARRALAQDPTAVQALNVLALSAQIKGDTERTRRLFGYSLTLSRRELASRLWAIEEAVSRGDIADALRNYDFALKTSNDASGLLFPVLANALSQPRIREELLPIMRARPTWGPAFTDYLSRAAVNPEGTAAFYPLLQQAGLPVSPLQNARVVDALSARGYDSQAWTYYAKLHPGADRAVSRNPEFRSSTIPATVFDWQPLNESGLSAAIGEKAGGRGEMIFSIAPTSSGKLAQQRQLLPPGRYTLSGRAEGLAVAERERPYFAVVCDMGRELTQAPLPAAGKSTFAVTFTVTADCPTQFLALMARQTDDPSGIEGTVQRASITPAGAPR